MRDLTKEPLDQPEGGAIPGLPGAGQSDLRAWLRLATQPGLGRVAARKLLSALGLPEQVLGAGTEVLRQYLPLPLARALAAPPEPAHAACIEAALRWAAGPHRHLLTLADANYPRGLLDLADPPLLLYCQGQLSRLAGQALAVVGARHATVQGSRDAERFARAFAEAGFTVVSGLASGIDAAAHQGALECGGATVAVMGTGIDRVYPPGHRALAQRIGVEGLLLTEFEPAMPARSSHFPQRNRLIAALSRGVLVVEAALRSGSLITARLSAELGREVFAVPGSIHAPLSRGCHRLIREGAKLVEQPSDVLEEFGFAAPHGPLSGLAGGTAHTAHDPFGSALAYDPVDADTLASRAGLPAEAAAAALLQLELAGAVERLPGNRYRRLG